MTFSVVIPARNEERNIGPTLDAIRECLRRGQIPYEILVVDDGSTDETVAVVQQRSATDKGIRLLRNDDARGFGYAVRRGLAAFTGEVVAIMMADGSDAPEDLVRYYEILQRAECAFGSRFMRGSRVHDYPKVKLVINRVANLFIRVLFGTRYNDVTNAFKAYRAQVIQGCGPLLSPHFNLTVELPLKAIVRGYSYEVIPISWRGRIHGVSSLQLKEMGSRYLFIVLHVWLEKMLTKQDYRRPRTGAPVPAGDRAPGDADAAEARSAAAADVHRSS